MRKSTLTLAVLLGISLLINGMTMVRLMKDRKGKDRSNSSRIGDPVADVGTDEPSYAAAPADGSELSAVLYELRKLRKEVGQLKKGGSGSTDSPTADPSDDVSAKLASDPEVARLLVEKEAMDEFFADLKTLNRLKKELGDEKHRTKVMEATAQFLGLNESQAAAFNASSILMFQELEAAKANQQTAYKGLKWDRNNPSAYRDQQKQINDAYSSARSAALTRIQPYLSGSTRRTTFEKQVNTWLYYAGGQSFGGKGMKRW